MSPSTSQSRSTATLALAALLSAAVPGVGHAVVGRPLRGLAIALAFALVGVLALAMFLFVPTIAGVVLPLALAVGARAWAGFDAVRVGRSSSGMRGSLRAVSALALLLVAYGLHSASTNVRSRFTIGSFRLPSGSMEPTVLEGDYFVTRLLAPNAARRDEVVAFTWPHDPAQMHVSRVVGLPGDTVEMRKGVLVRNGRAVEEPYARYEQGTADTSSSEFDWQRPHWVGPQSDATSYRASAHTWGPLRVPDGMYFLLGDNRDNALDSRFVGFAAAEGIRAVPHRIYFSRDAATGSVRWSRIGLILTRPPN